MASKQEQSAIYSGNTIIMTLPESIGIERFLAVWPDFKTPLINRNRMPNSVRALIIGMFEQRVTARCEIVYGTKAIFTLSETDVDGHQLTCDGKRRRFEEAYVTIVGRSIKITYPSDKPVFSDRSRGNRSRSHGDGFLSEVGDFFGDIIESLFSGD